MENSDIYIYVCINGNFIYIYMCTDGNLIYKCPQM